MHDSRSGPNALPADRMTAAERLAEIGRILSAGLIRLRGRKSSSLSAPLGDSFVDFPAEKSGVGRQPRSLVGGIDAGS
jgi:hypothetical protein